MLNRFIYALKDPRTGLVRYIGKTTNGHQRTRQHANPSSLTKTHKSNWVRQLLALGLMYEVEVLEYGETEEDLNAMECFWICQGKGLGWPLTNGSLGGEGSRGHVRSAETRRRQAITNTGRKHTEEAKEKIRLAHLGRKKTPEHCAKIREAKRKQHAKPFTDQFGTVYRTVAEACEILGLNETCISRTLKRFKGKTRAKGYEFTYLP